jgi:hypothetical protein
MDLKELTEKLINETSSIFEAKGERAVTWMYPEVKILSLAQNGQEAGPGGTTDDSAQTEIIDPENQESGGGGEGGEAGGDPGGEGNDNGGGDGGSQSNNVKPGSIIQDMESGGYGRVTSVDANGDIEWEPVDKDEIKSLGFAKTHKNKLTIRGNTNGFFG